MITPKELASKIDHALLAPHLTDNEFVEGCKLGRSLGVASVCVKPADLRRCVDLLKGSPVKSSTVIGFPHGGTTIETKLFEAAEALKTGCQELDIVINVGKALSGDWNYLKQEIESLTKLTREHQQSIKVIFENCHLQDSHKIRLCEISREAGVDFVKTSTGFGSSGATEADVRLMRANVPQRIGVKASGGIQNLEIARKLLAAGASRLGMSRTAAVLKELENSPA
jgi:deoxyribose-phosphate aldolase